MKMNLHTHTTRCMHAVGEDEAYVRAALNEGMEILGFSDHVAHPFRDGYVSRCRMPMEQMDDYIASVLRLQNAYKDQICIPLGFEMEYYPALFGELMEILRDRPVDYLILGQHFLGNEAGERHVSVRCEGNDILRAYCHQSMDAMNTGVFTYFCHPDLIRFDPKDSEACQLIRGLCREAKSCGLPLEVNLLGVRDGRYYPNPEFWQIAAEEGCPTVIGWDAHAPEHLDCPDAVRQAMDLIAQFGLERIEDIPIRSLR